MREERARFCAAASSSPGDDLASGALISRDSVFPTRSAIFELSRKQRSPVAGPKAPASLKGDVRRGHTCRCHTAY